MAHLGWCGGQRLGFEGGNSGCPFVIHSLDRTWLRPYDRPWAWTGDRVMNDGEICPDFGGPDDKLVEVIRINIGVLRVKRRCSSPRPNLWPLLGLAPTFSRHPGSRAATKEPFPKEMPVARSLLCPDITHTQPNCTHMLPTDGPSQGDQGYGTHPVGRINIPAAPQWVFLSVCPQPRIGAP